MKKINYIKGVLLQGAFAVTILLIASCNNSQKPEDTKAVAEEHNEAKFDNDKQEKDAQFLVHAAELNLEGIHLGQLAQQNGKSAHVKELGKMMEDAHSESQRDLVVLAKSKNITIPTKPTNDTKDAYTKLNKKSGNDFDKAYADFMVNEHEDAIELFEKGSSDCTDEDIKNWAKKTLPDLHTHLHHSIECQKKCNKI